MSCALGPESVGELEQAARALRHGDVDELAARERAGLAAGVAQLTPFKLEVVAMALIDAMFIIGQLSKTRTRSSPPRSPRRACRSSTSRGWAMRRATSGDFLAAALVGASLARERRDQLLAAAATFVVTQAFDQLFLVVDTLPATVPPALVMLALESRRPVHGSARALPAR